MLGSKFGLVQGLVAGKAGFASASFAILRWINEIMDPVP